jgi:hypothetical protein
MPSRAAGFVERVRTGRAKSTLWGATSFALGAYARALGSE